MKKWKFPFIIFSWFCFAPTLWAAPLQQLTLILDWFVNPNHAPLYVAEQEGFFKQQGLQINFIAPADPADPPKLVAAGKADLAITYQPQLVLQTQQGLPLIRVATLIDHPLNCLLVNSDGPIYTLKDLKGKRIGYSLGASDHAILSAMLKTAGLTLDNVNFINVRYDLTQALLSKQVDAVIGTMRNFEPLEVELAGKSSRIFPVEKYGVPDYAELIIIGNSKNKLSAETLRHFNLALKEGVEYLEKNPELSWKSFAKNHPELNNELNHRAWFKTLAYFALDPGASNPVKENLVSNFFTHTRQFFI